jgi:hypothetical protein
MKSARKIDDIKRDVAAALHRSLSPARATTGRCAENGNHGTAAIAAGQAKSAFRKHVTLWLSLRGDADATIGSGPV